MRAIGALPALVCAGAWLLAGCPGSTEGVAGAVSAPAPQRGSATSSAQRQPLADAELQRRLEVLEQGLLAREARLAELERALAVRDALIADLRQELEQLARTRAAAEELAALSSSVEELRAQLEGQQRAIEQLRRRHGDAVQHLEQELGRLGRELAALSEQLARQARVVESLRTHSPVPNIEREVPRIEARVLAVQRGAAGETVLLSAGSAQGVQAGYEFTLQREGALIAKVRVDDVGAHLAGARVVYRREGAEIREGDLATTRP